MRHPSRARPWLRPGPSGEAGFTIVEVLAAGAILSAVALCLVKAWAVFDRMSLDLVLRQKAAFVLNGEMERLWRVYTSTSYGATDHDGSYGKPVPGLPSSSSVRFSYEATSNTSSFTTTQTGIFNPGPGSQQSVLNASASMVFLGASLPAGTSSSTPPQNWVWLDQRRGLVARLSWTLCKIVKSNNDLQPCWGAATSSTAPPPAPVWVVPFACAAYDGSRGWASSSSLGNSNPCELMIAVLEYPYAFNNGAPQAVGTTRTLTLSTIVGRRI